MANLKTLPTDPILEELIAIKRLLVFQSLKAGATQKEVASALNLDPSRISRMFPNSLGKLASSTGKKGK